MKNNQRLSTRVAAVTRCYRQPLKIALRTAQQMGVSAVQIDAVHELEPTTLSGSGQRQFLHRLNEYGLSLASLSVPLEKALSDQHDLDARIDRLKKTMEFAYQLKAKTVIARIGRIPEERESPAYLTLISALNDLARHANLVGTVLSITPTRDSFSAIADLFSEVVQGPIGLHLDPAGLIAGELSPTDFLTRFADSIEQIQIRDAVHDLDGNLVETTAGNGAVNWNELLAIAVESNFRGWLTVERTNGNKSIMEMAHAVQFVRHLLPG